MLSDVANTNKYLTNWTGIFWIGRNDFTADASTAVNQVVTNLARMVAAQSNGKYFILPVCNTKTNEALGTTNYTYFTNLVDILTQTYTNHFIDLRSYLISQAPTNAQDQADAALDQVPTSMTADGVHFTITWDGVIANYMKQRISLVEATYTYAPTVPFDLINNANVPLARGPQTLIDGTPFNSVIAASTASKRAPTISIVNTNGVLETELRSSLSDFFWGSEAGSNTVTYSGQNQGIGFQALKSLTSGTYNQAYGPMALSSVTTSTGCAAFGWSALKSQTSTGRNSAFGWEALMNDTTGVGNNAFGFLALTANVSGSQNSAFGESALAVSTGANNSAFGYQSLSLAISGAENSAFGYLSLGSTTIGSQNLGLGFSAGQGAGASTASTNDDYMIFIGYKTGKDASFVTTKLTNSIVLGRNARALGSHLMTVGAFSSGDSIDQLITGDSTVSGILTSSNQVFIAGTTNQLKFGATNAPPVSSAAPTKWISVTVSGDAGVYRLPLYE